MIDCLTWFTVPEASIKSKNRINKNARVYEWNNYIYNENDQLLT